MTGKQRPTAKKILEAVVQAMYDAQEPLDEGLVLVPPVYDVLLHPEAYHALQSLLPRIKMQARKRLDDELAHLNRQHTDDRAGVVRRLLHRILRLFSAERYVQRMQAVAATYERAGERWAVDIGVTAEPEAGIDYLAVETDFAVEGAPVYKGRPTVNIRRRTMVLPDGRFETVLTADRPVPKRTVAGRPGDGGRPAVRVMAPPDALARLTYEDDTGRRTYYMTGPRLSIGRHDDAAVADLTLHTLPDVSRVHVLIRLNTQTRTFSLKDVSRFGVTVDGVKVHPGDPDDDRLGWNPLPADAEIGLANAVFIQFEALLP